MASLANYQKLEKLGQGTYGVVYKAMDRRTDEYVALKVIRLDHEEEGIPPTSIREVSILKELNHPNVVALKEVINSESKLTIVLEFLNVDLKRYLDQQRTGLSSALIKSYAYQMLAGICYCHCHRIIHRDMKPQNLLLNNQGLLKLADFGLARAFTIPLRNYTHEVVTLWYRAPEILLGAKYYSIPIDVWSCGCIIAEMITRSPLFAGDSEIDELFSIFRVLGTVSEENFKGVSALPLWSEQFPKWKKKKLGEVIKGADSICLDLIEKMLKYDPVERISAREALDHPWFDDLAPAIKKTCRPKELDFV
jgi:serine/threonine protein kinase